MILLTSKDYYTLKSPRTREHECVRQGKFACVPYINMFPRALVCVILTVGNRHFSLLNVSYAGACSYDFLCDGERLVRVYLRRRRGVI